MHGESHLSEIDVQDGADAPSYILTVFPLFFGK